MHHFFTICFRNIKNNPKLFFINITSFSIGIVAVMFIYLFVAKEYSTDKFHKKHKYIYRVLQNRTNAPTRISQTPFPLGDLFLNNYAEIQEYTRYYEVSNYSLKINEKQFPDQSISFVDRPFFTMFDFKLDAGDYNAIFDNPNTIIIDRTTAEKYFNTTEVLGKTIEAEELGGGRDDKRLLTITGLLSDLPEESTLQPRIITNIKDIEGEYADFYFVSASQLYLHIPHCDDIGQLSKKLSITLSNKENEFRTKKAEINSNKLFLQKFDDLYLQSSNVEDDLPKGTPSLLRILISIGIILMAITFINYIIINIGLGLKYQKQNQIHIVLGGNSGWMKKKYIIESVFYATMAFLGALLLLPIAHGIVNSFYDYRYDLFSKSDFRILFSFFLILILLGIFSGWVQYFVLSLRKKTELGLINLNRKEIFFKNIIVLQLFVFISITTGLFLITKQVNFMKNQELGFDLENTITVMINDYDEMNLFVQEFENKTDVDFISVGHTLFNSVPYLDDIEIEETKTKIGAQLIWGDHNFIETYNIKLLAGKNLDGSRMPSVNNAYSYERNNTVIDILVNEEFVRKSGLKDPLGTIVSIPHYSSKGEIAGIVANVKNLPIYYSTTPIVIGYGLNYAPSLIASVKREKMDGFKADVNTFIKKIKKESHYGYGTYEYNFERWYKKEQTLFQLLIVFSVVTLFILILGLVGISLFTSERKTKEIGIRKVNGAKVLEILSMLNRDYLKWVIVAFIISSPIAWYIMDKWLENFAYKTEISWWIFALAGAIALFIALFTVSWQSWRAASRNPVEALRYE